MAMLLKFISGRKGYCRRKIRSLMELASDSLRVCQNRLDALKEITGWVGNYPEKFELRLQNHL